MVSVIVPAYNLGAYVRDAVASVLHQSMPDLECIVVDDGSSDDTAAVVATFTDPRVRYVHKSNRGTVSDARNVGISHARGELVAFLDADDWWFPHKLERQVAVHRSRPGIGIIYCGYVMADPDLRVRTVVSPAREMSDLRRQILLDGVGLAFASTALVPRRVLDEIGGFNLELSVSEDIDLAERIARVHGVVGLSDPLAVYRMHGAQGHRRLDRYEHDVHWLLDDRFGEQGARDPEAWSHGHANLHMQLALHAARGRDVRRARRHLSLALREEPRTVIGMPRDVMIRRFKRRLQLLGRKRRLDEEIAATLALQRDARGA